MSTFISASQLFLQDLSFMDAVLVLLGAALVFGTVMLFQPLLRGIARAAMMVVKPKMSKEEQLNRRKMHDAMLLKSMLNSPDGSPSHAAELYALASRS